MGAGPEGLADLQTHALRAGIPSQRTVGALGHPGMHHGGTYVAIIVAGSSRHEVGRYQIVEDGEGGGDEFDLGAGYPRGAHGKNICHRLLPVLVVVPFLCLHRRGTSCAGFTAAGRCTEDASRHGGGEGGPIGGDGRSIRMRGGRCAMCCTTLTGTMVRFGHRIRR